MNIQLLKTKHIRPHIPYQLFQTGVLAVCTPCQSCLAKLMDHLDFYGHFSRPGIRVLHPAAVFVERI
ncbi:hypothetical protein D1872_217260 [compost metagenome]